MGGGHEEEVVCEGVYRSLQRRVAPAEMSQRRRQQVHV